MDRCEQDRKVRIRMITNWIFWVIVALFYTGAAAYLIYGLVK